MPTRTLFRKKKVQYSLRIRQTIKDPTESRSTRLDIGQVCVPGVRTAALLEMVDSAPQNSGHAYLLLHRLHTLRLFKTRHIRPQKLPTYAQKPRGKQKSKVKLKPSTIALFLACTVP